MFPQRLNYVNCFLKFCNLLELNEMKSLDPLGFQLLFAEDDNVFPESYSTALHSSQPLPLQSFVLYYKHLHISLLLGFGLCLGAFRKSIVLVRFYKGFPKISPFSFWGISFIFLLVLVEHCTRALAPLAQKFG